MLSYIVAADGPVTATEVARHCGTHQTTASRILGDLVNAGYVRRAGYREFVPDYGILVLGLESTRHFAVLNQPRLAMEYAAKLCSGLTVSLCLLWNGRLLYVDQVSRGVETQMFRGRDYPLHLSSPGLLFMLELPQVEALAALETSRGKFGWAQPTSEVAPTAEGVLQSAKRHYRHDSLVLSGWAEHGHISAAIRLPDHEGTPVALTISGAKDVMTPETIRLRLLEIRRIVEPTMPSG